ncbi:MAG TPA: ABC transporter permease [Acidimicrobiales bacterium]|jgi:peptide/nickel transport system permease protein|nr:ABC transporter permease [Acidimicrobiales bacterium]
MIGYSLRRLVQSIIVILGVALIVFLLSQLIPGGVAGIALGPRRTAAAIAHFNKENGYDLPIYEQFWNYLWGVFHLQLGYSYNHNQQVQQLIAQRLPRTLTLVGVSTLVALVIAVPLGILQVVRRYKPIDYALTTLSFVLYAMPAFFLAFLLVLFFSFDLHLFPVSPPGTSSAWTIFTDPRAFVLPVVTLSALTIASFSRYMRSSMMDALAEDYVRTALAKGASNNRILYGHALRNALIPILTLIGLSLPAIASGALITESVFNYPGMGLLTVQSALSDDVPTILGTTLVVTLFTVAGSFLADVLYAVADPRIRLGGTE